MVATPDSFRIEVLHCGYEKNRRAKVKEALHNASNGKNAQGKHKIYGHAQEMRRSD
jgi:hypothetical protein